MTAATQPAIEELLAGALPWTPPIRLHDPFLAYAVGDDFLEPFSRAAEGKLAPFILVVEGSIPNEHNKPEDTSYCLGVPNREFRLALARPFLNGKINLGINMMTARGYTGQTAENFATDYQPGYLGPVPVPDNPVAEVVGVRIPSYASVTFTYRFGR